MKYLPTLLVTIIIFKLLFSKKKRRYRKRRYIRYKSRTARIKSNYTNSKKFKTARQRGRYELKKYKKSQYLNSEYYAKTLLPWKTIETDKGRRGEYEVYARLAQLDGPRDFFFNVYVPRDDGTTTEADIVMVHPKGLFVYEVKNYEGWIFGRFEQANWTQCLPGQFEAQKFKFFNPIKQNKVHVKALSEYLGLPRERIIPITAFSDACEFKDLSGTAGGKVPNLCKFSTVFAATELAIMQSKYEMTEDEYSSLCHEIENLCNADEATKAAHILHVREQQEKARARFAGNKNKPAAEDGEEDTREEAELPETVQADTSEASNDEGRTPGEEPPSDATVRVLCPSCGSEIKPWEGGVCRLCGTRVG